MLMDKIHIGYIDIPKDYWDLNINKKRELCENILDKIFLYLDNNLDQSIDRISFLRAILDSSLESSLEYENYEMSAMITDCIKILDEERN